MARQLDLGKFLELNMQSMNSRVITTSLTLSLIITLAIQGGGVEGSTRTLIRIDQGWKFTFEDIKTAQQPDFDDSSWQIIPLPHNWGWEDAQRGKPYRRGPGWYRRILEIKPSQGKRYFIRFEAAGSVADVYLNGKHLGHHRGAFGAFCYELTPHLNPSGTNVLAVRVSNAPESDVAPLSGDFPVYGGLYRPVWLIETPEICITPLDHGSPGVAWLQTSVTNTQAILDVIVQISNARRQRTNLTLVCQLLDRQNNPIAETIESIVSQPRITEPFWAKVIVQNPHLWHGRKDPYLYKAVVKLMAPDNSLIDEVIQYVGLRSFTVDPEKGFILNGEPYPVRGVNRHQDRPDKGWAISEQDMEEDLALILEMGATAVRCAHYQHSSYFYSLCDRAGLLVWAELPLVDRIDPSEKFADTSRRQLLDLIRQNINHPSIFAWSLYNEIRPNTPDPHRLLLDLHNLARAEDPTRPTIAATCTLGLPQMNRLTSWLGWNIYPGWYPEWGSLDEIPRRLEQYRKSARLLCYCLSEYGAGANIHHHEDPPKMPVHNGQWHPEEWQSIVHEAVWYHASRTPYIWGTFLWNMFDFTSYWRNEGGVPGRNDKGIVTYDRKTRKDVFYFYKANWSDEPTLYITSRRYTERTNKIANVKVYSNAKEVDLFLNGKSLGKKTPERDCIFLWPQVTLYPGENRLEARAMINGKVYTDSCTWTLKE